MLKPFLAATLLALSTSFALAEDNSLTGKAMSEHPGTMGGSTANPTAKPNSGSLSEQQMQNQPGVNSDRLGTTASPNAVPADGSLSAKVMKDEPGAQK